MMKLLIVEDDIPLARFLGKGLSQEHYSVDVVHDGEQARKMACEGAYDLIVLDLNLPRLDGISVLGQIRETRQAPVLILTGRTKLEDRVHALDLGADDCLLKPFSFAELSARIRALLRRGAAPEAVTLRVGDLELDRVHRVVRRGGKRIELTTKEFALLEYLMRHAGQRVTRTMILEHVWNLNFDNVSTTSREQSCLRPRSKCRPRCFNNRSSSSPPCVRRGNRCALSRERQLERRGTKAA